MGILKTILFLAAFSSSFNLSARQRSNQSLEIGSKISNTGFENLSCTQMIETNLRFLVQKKITLNAINSEFKLCLQRERNVNIFSRDLESCNEEAVHQTSEYEKFLLGFVNALHAKIRMYDTLYIGDARKLMPECRKNSEFLKRASANMSDADFIKSINSKCGVADIIFASDLKAMRNSYGAANLSQFNDRSVCQSYLENYQDEQKVIYSQRNASPNTSTQSSGWESIANRYFNIRCSLTPTPCPTGDVQLIPPAFERCAALQAENCISQETPQRSSPAIKSRIDQATGN